MFNYKWFLKDGYNIEGVEKNNLKVFSTFSCGGGSTMGYKLAGYNVIGANDIDKQMAKIYQKNHNPKYYFLCPIGDLKNKELPEELYNLDILDGSPPCSTFSISGTRERDWKVEKKFREGQSKQILSDLFFDWIDLVQKLKPKVAIAENVKGMILGNAKIYTKKVIKELEKIGYKTQIFLLNGATMGLPQSRERIFFVCRRKDLNFPELKLNFNEKQINFSDITEGIIDIDYKIKGITSELYDKAKEGENLSKYHPKKSFFNYIKISNNKPLPTITASGEKHFFTSFQKRYLTKKEFILGGSFPLDYDFMDLNPVYAIGMSVPPIMMAHLSYEIYKQFFKK